MIQTTIDLSKIAPPDALVIVDHAAKVAQMKAQLVAARPDLAPALELASEPLVKLIEAWAYEAILKAGEINAGVRAMLLASAQGADLDHLAANHLVSRREGEDDDTFRLRAALGPEGWATAGPKGAYVYHALSASPLVADVDVTKPAPGQVRVAVLSHAADGVADENLLAVVAAALNADEVRPLTDQVLVASAGVSAFDVAAVIKVRAGPDAEPVARAAELGVAAYAQTRRKIGMGVTRAALVAALMPPGAEDVALLSPAADVVALEDTAPVLGAINLTVEVAQ